MIRRQGPEHALMHCPKLWSVRVGEKALTDGRQRRRGRWSQPIWEVCLATLAKN